MKTYVSSPVQHGIYVMSLFYRICFRITFVVSIHPVAKLLRPRKPCMCMCAGTASSCSLWQRISVMQVMRRLCADAYFLNFLYVTYDAKEVQTLPLPP